MSTNEPMTQEWLDAIQERLDAVEADPPDEDWSYGSGVAWVPFCEHAREDVPALLAEVERLREALDAALGAGETEVRQSGWCRMETVTGPGCQKCRKQWAATLDGLPPSRFIACPGCGNKRCPKAEWHGYKCTGSNELGQLGDPE